MKRGKVPFYRRFFTDKSDDTGISIKESTISRPVNSANYPNKKTNQQGLKTILPVNPTEESTKPTKSIDDKLLDGDVDDETTDVINRSIDLVINVVDKNYIDVPDITEISYPESVMGADFIGYDVDFDISFNVSYGDNNTLVEVGISDTKLAFKTNDKKLTFNVKDIFTEHMNESGVDNSGKLNIPIHLTPVKNTNDFGEIRGKTERLDISFDAGDLTIPRSVAINRLAEGFINQFSNCSFDDSNYLTNLLHLGDGDNKLITTWTGLKEDDGYNSLILKLYEPLPAEIQTNNKVWITKLQSNPIIETVTLVGDSIDYCTPLKGPNFSIEENSDIGYQVYDELLATDSSTNSSLIQKYVSKQGIDTQKLNIEYTKDGKYYFENFVHFGSVEERIKNFWYKIQLLESYQAKYNSITNQSIKIGITSNSSDRNRNGYTTITDNGDITNLNTADRIQSDKQIDTINNLISSFDGFEDFLYTSKSNLAYPKDNNDFIVSTEDNRATTWYNYGINEAANFDRNNVNYLNNNLPEFITEDYENEDFMLFMDMIGHHFDVIWVYVNTLTKLKSPQHSTNNGFSNELIYHMLESLGWDGKKAFDSKNLWEYALGLNKDGTQKYQQSLKSSNEEIWRRVLNNLPYLLKNKGTSRSLKAVMACYGVPQSLLTVMEFGGPTDPTNGGSQPFTFDDRTAALKFVGSQYISTEWKSSPIPMSIEMNLKFNKSQNHNLVQGINGSSTYFDITVEHTKGIYGEVVFSIFDGNNNNPLDTIKTPNRKLFDSEYKNITLTKDGDVYKLYLKQSNEDRLLVDDMVELTNTSTYWESPNEIQIGNLAEITLDEFRLWKTPLDNNIITTHAKLPDATNGNEYDSSTSDLILRHDFEYPKNRSNYINIKNVSISTEYGLNFSTAVGFDNIDTYPYNYETYDRRVTAQVPSLGFNQSDKIRFESQTLISDLSHKARATKKSLDRAPIDSSRLGLFFSPMKEINMDIVKSFGDFNIDNYIGSPADEYKTEYSDLTDLREYYFQRLNRDIYEYIRLIRYVDKSLFDVLEDLAPARAKVSSGLLIEPHYLERSKTKWDRPISERGDLDTSIDIDKDIELLSENTQYDVDLEGGKVIDISHQYDNYDADIEYEDETKLEAENAQYDTNIDFINNSEFEGEYTDYLIDIKVPSGATVDATAATFGFQQVGMEDDSLENAGFGLYTPLPATGSVTRIDSKGNTFYNREQIYLIEERYFEKVKIQTRGWPATSLSEQIGYEVQTIPKTKYRVSTVEVGANAPTIGNEIVGVTPLNGYLSSHYRYKNNLSEGLQQSFFKGTTQTRDTTPDGLDPVEVITTNPNILRVADAGRGSGEPILRV